MTLEYSSIFSKTVVCTYRFFIINVMLRTVNILLYGILLFMMKYLKYFLPYQDTCHYIGCDGFFLSPNDVAHFQNYFVVEKASLKNFVLLGLSKKFLIGNHHVKHIDSIFKVPRFYRRYFVDIGVLHFEYHSQVHTNCKRHKVAKLGEAFGK